MNVIRLHGKMSPSSGIVHIRNKFNRTAWVIEFDKKHPDDLAKAKLLYKLR